MTQAVGLLTTLHPTMLFDADDPLGMAQKIVAHVALQNAVVEAAREFLDAEWMVTHDWGGDREAVRSKLLSALDAAKGGGE